MKTYSLNRIRKLPSHTEGMLHVGVEVFSILELPDLNNTPFISCIPEGTYLVKRNKTGKHQYYEVQDVPERTHIELHPATVPAHLQGCIAAGYGFRGKSLVHSHRACDKLLEIQGDEDFYLEITYIGE